MILDKIVLLAAALAGPALAQSASGTAPTLISDAKAPARVEHIRRLFGVNLGTSLSEYQQIGKPVIESGFTPAPEWVQRIHVPEPNPLFKTYSVKFNPATKAIYQVMAESRVSNEECKILISQMSSSLRRVYVGYEFLERDGGFAIDDHSSPIMPSYQVACVGDRILIWLTDYEGYRSHQDQNEDRSAVSTDGL